MDLIPMPLTMGDNVELSRGQYAAEGAAFLGSAIGQDWLGAGATLFTILGNLRAGTDLEQWLRTLERLA